MNKINLRNLELKTFTEQDVLDYCLLNNLISEEILILFLTSNSLTDISGIRLFKNLERLDLQYNQIKDISALKDLIKLEILDIRGLGLKSDQIEYIKPLKNLKQLYCREGFKDMSVLNQLNNTNLGIYKRLGIYIK